MKVRTSGKLYSYSHLFLTNSSVREGRQEKTVVRSVATSNSARKDILKFKDKRPRRWKRSKLVFYTLDGSEIRLSSWQPGGSHNSAGIRKNLLIPLFC